MWCRENESSFYMRTGGRVGVRKEGRERGREGGREERTLVMPDDEYILHLQDVHGVLEDG